MDPRFTAAQEQWRAEVRAFLDAELPSRWERNSEFCEDEEFWKFAFAFTRKVSQRGWIGLTWPTEYGGLARPVIDRLIMAEEFSYRDAPLVNSLGWGLAAGALLAGGSDEQKRRFLPPIARSEVFWAEGFTEPGSGSDLASLTTRARRHGDGWVVNGQKTYTTWGSHSDVMFLAARTDPDASRHRGISIFCLDLHAPGVTLTPLHNLGGGRQNHTFFDNVEVPGDALIGEVNQGWNLIMNAFYGGSAYAPYMEHQRILDNLIAWCRVTERRGRPLIDDPVTRDRLTEMALIVEANRLLTYRSLGALAAARPQPYAGALGVVVQKEGMPRFAELTNLIVGPLGQLAEGAPFAPMDGGPEAWYRQAFRNHAGGTSQVKRMVLATRGLGLTR
jgi:alkylation response protein AidB-like acyl-CoA dehydrogenase